MYQKQNKEKQGLKFALLSCMEILAHYVPSDIAFSNSGSKWMNKVKRSSRLENIIFSSRKTSDSENAHVTKKKWKRKCQSFQKKVKLFNGTDEAYCKAWNIFNCRCVVSGRS